MKTYKWFFGLLLMSFVFSGCGPVYYVPSGKNVPLFKEAGETRYAANVAAGFFHMGGDAYLAKAFDDKHAGLLTVSSHRLNNSGGGFTIDAGYGKYKSLNQVFVFELYGGAGFGTLRNFHNSPQDTLFNLPADYRKTQTRVSHLGVWAQPQLGLTTRFFDLALVGGIRYMSMISVRQNGLLWPEQQQELFYLRANKGNLLWEPGIVIRMGWDMVKIEMQYNFSYNLNNPSLFMDPFRLGFGLSLMFPH